MRIMSVVGARPNFMKIASFINAIDKRTTDHRLRQPAPDRSGGLAGTTGAKLEHCLVHTGQHYDEAMSKAFFEALGLPKPDVDLGVGSGTHAEQVGKTMMEFEKVVRDWKPDWIVVVGDVNATCACSIVAKKEHVNLAHIEAGLRSFDLDMPEEINRMVTDRLADMLFTTSEFANTNLRNEGVPEDKIKFVGNIMIDTLEANRVKAEALKLGNILTEACQAEGMGNEGNEVVEGGGFAVLTLHRPSNVDSEKTLEPLVRFFIDVVSKEMPLVWTLHPRTRERLDEFGLLAEVEVCEGILLLDPIGYLEMLRFNMEARIVLTDSGGLQEECCILGTPCVTLRENTERPVTLRENGGVSVLAGNDVERIAKAFQELKDEPRKEYRPPLWDGGSAQRIVDELLAE